jgi:glycosyltransferase involved in cell wall biosynthesis
MHSIAVLLPLREKFSPHGAGALALCSQEFGRASRFRDSITVYGRPVSEPLSGVRFVPISSRSFFFRSASHRTAFRRALQANPPALIETWNRPIFIAPLKRWFPDIPITIHLENDPQEMRGARTPRERRRLLDLVSRVYACSHWVRERFMEGLDEPETANRVVTIPNAVEISETLPTKEKLILFVGRIVEDKGALLYAQAMRALLPNFPDWTAQIIGRAKHGAEGETEYSQRVAQEFTQLGTQGIMTGYLPLDQVRETMGRASVLCVPSLWNEPFGRVAVEGLAEGALVATTGRGGLAEVVGPAGLIINSEVPGDWAQSLRPFLADRAKFADTAERSRRQAQNFALGAVTAQLDAQRSALMTRA